MLIFSWLLVCCLELDSMNISQIEENVQKLVANFTAETFIYDLLLAYGFPKPTIARLKKGTHNLSKNDEQIILKKKLFFQVVKDRDIHSAIEALRNDKQTYTHNPRFIIVTDYKTLLAIDTKTNDSLDVEITSLINRYDFFLPWAGMEKAQLQTENPADIKAAEKMAKLYDEILKDNPHKEKEDVHKLNVFLSRLLFCFFAEDTGIFEEAVFTNSIKSHTQEDGSDLNSYLERLFEVLNTKDNTDYPEYLRQFPYVNGGLFKEKYTAPKFSRRSRKLIIECGELQWREINPDIFGSMIQAVIDPEKRGGLGMHYTSVPNIMKVIEPLFLNELYEEQENNFDNLNKLEKLLKRIAKIKIFDPACGSGNFLIIAYKELRTLEMKIVKRVQELKTQKSIIFSNIHLSQFYGIEIDDFACEIATLSLWLAEHQMNMKYKEIFGISKPSLPLQESGKIVCGNATRINWEEVCPKKELSITKAELQNITKAQMQTMQKSQLQDEQDEIYILGNPPYLGAKLQNTEQKADIDFALKNIKNRRILDYISIWFILAAKYVSNSKAKYAFVSTNSICQGEQVSILWPKILEMNLEINFAYKSFKWSNNAKYNAGVTCIIVGVFNKNSKDKLLINENEKRIVKKINAYLSPSENIFIERKKESISGLPEMKFGNMAYDGGALILAPEEKDEIIKKDACSSKFIKNLVGALEFIRGSQRYCIWVRENDYAEANNIESLANRFEKCKLSRLESPDSAGRKLASTPYKFREQHECSEDGFAIFIPMVSSEKREYIPTGLLSSADIIVAPNLAIYDAEPWIFGVITSRMHMTWVRAVAGRLKTDYRYSAEICYNTFPLPELTQKQKEMITHHVINIIDERGKHPEKIMAELYNPDKMPEGLRQAHRDLDIALEQCYRLKPFINDDERLEHLFNLYEKMTSTEQQGGQKCLI